MSEQLAERLTGLIEEADDHRSALHGGLAIEGPSELLAELQRARGHLDRVESIVATLVGLRGRAAQANADRQADLDDAWNNQATTARVGFGHGDAAPRERYAGYSSRTVEEQLRARRAERDLRDVDTALEICRIYHRGIESYRRDIETRMRLISFATRLES